MPTKLDSERVNEELESSNNAFDDKKSITNDSRKADNETSDEEYTDDYEETNLLKNSQASVKFDKMVEKDKSKALDEEENESEKPRLKKKRTKKLKRFSESRTAFDGRKVLFTTECTQTDWSWKDDAETSGTAKVLTSRYGKSESRQTSGKTRSGGESVAEDRTVTDLTPFSLQPNDEFGIPLSDVSSDSDSENSDTETPKKSKQARRYPPLVGPPLILKICQDISHFSCFLNQIHFIYLIHVPFFFSFKIEYFITIHQKIHKTVNFQSIQMTNIYSQLAHVTLLIQHTQPLIRDK
ncbi:hypothetical protein Btru_069861 [Bulinus truncatus]|nr:hypothetical protein Btru_069861 [Bulinus truncatus]